MLTWLGEHRRLYNLALETYANAYAEARRLHCGITLPDRSRSGIIWDYERQSWHIISSRDIIPADPLMPQLRERGGKWYLPEPPGMADLYRRLPATELGGKWRVWTLSRLEIALREFRRRPEVGYPRFHKFHNHRSLGAGVQADSPVRLLHLPDRYPGQAVVRIAGLCVRVMMHRPLPPSAIVKCAVLTRDHDRRMWHICLQCELPAARPELRWDSKRRRWETYACQTADIPIGVDIGIKIPVATSNPNFAVMQPVALKKWRQKVIKRQRQLSRCKRGTKRRRRARERLARAHAKVTVVRKEWVHKQTAVLARQYRMIAVEDLALPNMTASAKGTAEAPGTNVKAKAGLNREMLSIAAGALRAQLEWKTQRAGGVMVAVNPRYTSRRCPACGGEVVLDRKRQMHCAACGLVIDRDVGAAQNILARARVMLVSSPDQEEVLSGGLSTDSEGAVALANPNDLQTLPSGATSMTYDGSCDHSDHGRHHPCERLSGDEMAGIARARQTQIDQNVAADARRRKRICAMADARAARALEKRRVSGGNVGAIAVGVATS